MAIIKNMTVYKEILLSLPDDKRMRDEFVAIADFYKNLPQDRLWLALRLAGQAAFLGVEIIDARKDVKKNPRVNSYQNGANQSGRKMSAELDNYMRMSKEYRDLMAQLEKLLPEEEKGEAEDGFEKFVGSR
ncbi:MAG: hypothetical protein FWE69_03795 [Clostridiales bacterium]|nr:hypothetical protein [Clostridiales bacterium]